MYAIGWPTMIGIGLVIAAGSAWGQPRAEIIGDWQYPPLQLPRGTHFSDIPQEDAVPKVLELKADGTAQILDRHGSKLTEQMGDDEGGNPPVRIVRYAISGNRLYFNLNDGTHYGMRFQIHGDLLKLTGSGQTTLLKRMPQVSHELNAVPRFVDLTLAGVHLGGGSDDIEFDPKSAYYLHTDGEMASGPIDVELFLTPDADQPGINDDAPAEATEDPGLPQVVRVRHLLLRTGRGVGIGDTPLQMRQKLGASPTHEEYHIKTAARVCQYEAKIPTSRVLSAKARRDYYTTGIWYYRAVYIFHHERLWSIRLLAARDANQPQLW